MADIALLWMANRAAEHELAFKPGSLQPTASPNDKRRVTGEDVRPDALGKKHNSMSLLYRAMGPLDCRLEGAPDSMVASSARLRQQTRDARYNPKTLRDYLAKHPDRVISVVESP